MGNDTTQPTTIDADLYRRFKKYVEDKHGQTRGVLREELESALRNHLNAENPRDPLARIENDVATIKAQLAESDGGEVVPEPCGPPSTTNDDAHTHTDTTSRAARDDDEADDAGDTADEVTKPGAKATKARKVEYVFESLANPDAIVIPPAVIDTKVDKAWGFGDRATDDIRDRIFDRYHAEAVSKGGATWEVALGRTEDARDTAIDEWQDNPEDTKVVPEGKFDGFDKSGVPNGVRRS